MKILSLGPNSTKFHTVSIQSTYIITKIIYPPPDSVGKRVIGGGRGIRLKGWRMIGGGESKL